jgi:alkanesulfonate monooxygenase SsuD/methylene tetrahydromethanopterin reductase-like flavin-dependent oxidoreductase (luciferase family)
LRGNHFDTHDAVSRFEGARPLPILIGTSGGPAMLRMSGEVAHGVIIPAGNRAFYEYAIGRFRESLAAAGRSDATHIVLNGNIAVGDDRAVALRSIRPLVADAIIHRAENRHSLRHMGITLEQARAWHADPASLPDEVVRDSAVAGTPDECVEGLANLAELGITQLSIRFPEEATIRSVGATVLPRLRGRATPGEGAGARPSPAIPAGRGA